MAPDTVLTEDGSITCLDQCSGELYHNRAGAYSEALQHYVQACDLAARLDSQATLSLLDVCFGLGYNTFVFLDCLLEYIGKQKPKHNEIFCQIVGIDRDAKILPIVSQVLTDPRFKGLCQQLNWTADTIKQMIFDWQKCIKYQTKINGNVIVNIEIEIKLADLRQTVPELARQGQHFNYIFHDGFSPRSMPELWTVDLFKQYTKMIDNSGRIITYSSATAVRGAFKECGLQIKKSAPLGRKSGGTVACRFDNKEIADGGSILLLSDDENFRLNSRSAIPYRDPDLNSSREHILQARILEIEQSRLPVYDRKNDERNNLNHAGFQEDLYIHDTDR